MLGISSGKNTSIMHKLKLYLEKQKTEFDTYSVVGKAIEYILKHWTLLSQFLRHANTPLDTNIVEQRLS